MHPLDVLDDKEQKSFIEGLLLQMHPLDVLDDKKQKSFIEGLLL